MYHEIEGQYNMPTIIFDEDRLIVGNDTYPYSEIEKIEIIGTPIFATYGIMGLRVHEKDLTVPYVRSRTQKIKRALREYERLREKGDLTGSNEQRNAGPVQAADPYEEMKKLKELLDLSIITQEEFEIKKKEILGL